MSQAVSREPVVRHWPSPTIVGFVLMLMLTVFGISWVALALSDPSALPIRKVSVEGEFTHLDPEVLQGAVVDAVDAGFFGLDVGRIRQRLMDEPWIREAHIRRVWPDTLHVRILEQTPVSRWGQHALLNEVGDIFAPPASEIPPGLVLLDGPLGSEVDILSEYRHIRDQLETVALGVAAVTVTPRFAWSVRTADGKEIVLGRKDPRRRLQRFLFAHRRGLAQSWAQIGRVDLRYPNGLAVAPRPSGEQSMETTETTTEATAASIVEG